MKLPKLKLGTVYQVEWFDHYSTDSHTPEEAVKHKDVTLITWGRLVAVNRKHVILCFKWENNTSSNNDNMHILKKEVKSIKEMK